MRNLLLFVLLLVSTTMLNAQGAGFGYTRDKGERYNFDVGEGYEQNINSTIHSFFVRWHSHGGKQAGQIITGVRLDKIGFQNNTYFLAEDQESLENYNVDAYLKRIAWRFGYLHHHQLLGKPGKLVLSINYGMAYEFTSQMVRESDNDYFTYHLYSEQNRHNLVLMGGVEARLWHFTMGVKVENMLFDMINHDYIKEQPPAHNNSSELRGLKLSPVMTFLYLGVNFDFFNHNYAQHTKAESKE